MAGLAAMMAETPQMEEPTASSEVSLGLSLKVRPRKCMKVSESVSDDGDEEKRDAAEMKDVAEQEARAEQHDAGLQPELVGGDAGLEDARECRRCWR